MKDLDFDELDRAVNSLMSNAGSDTSDEPKEKVVTIPTTVATHDIPPSLSATIPTTTTQPDVATLANPRRSSASPAARRGGRFMDVVRPSSNTVSTAPNRVSREGVTIAAPVAPTATLPEPVASPEPDNVAEATQTEPTVPSWPDPIDFHKDASVPSAGSARTAAPETSAQPQSDAQDPLQTPFLSGAKVEKRPLGAFAVSPNVAVDAFAAPPTTDDQPTATDETTQSEQQPVAPTPAALPDELKSDIVAIESDTGTVEVEKTEVTATVQPSVPPAATTVSLGTTSIKQQYQEEPSTTPVEHAPIYDSEPYHQPLAHPAKKKSGWLVVLLIFTLLILGAGAGAAIYFYVL